MKKLGIGVIGIGGRLRGVCQQVHKVSDDVEVVAVQDPDERNVDKAKEVFNSEAKVYEDYNDLVASPDVDWVMIGSWNCFHADQVVAAFEAGKHVFCEKPLALSLEDAIRMRDAWQKAGTHFIIGFTLRYSPHYERIKEIISSGKIGKVLSMEFNETLEFNHGGYIHSDWRRKTEWAGTHLLEKCCHDVDLVNWMLESVAVKAAAFGGCDFFTPENAHHMDRIGPNENGKQAFNTWGNKVKNNEVSDPFNNDKDILDNQVAILQYASGARATFHTNCLSGIPERRMYICGTEGALRADVIQGSIEVKRIGWDTEMEDCSTEAKGGHGGGDTILGQSIVDSMFKDLPPRSSLEDGLRAAITCFGVDQAQTSGTVVDLHDMWDQAGIEIS